MRTLSTTITNLQTCHSGLPMSAAGSYSVRLTRERLPGSEIYAYGGRDVVRVGLCGRLERALRLAKNRSNHTIDKV